MFISNLRSFFCFHDFYQINQTELETEVTIQQRRRRKHAGTALYRYERTTQLVTDYKCSKCPALTRLSTSKHKFDDKWTRW